MRIAELAMAIVMGVFSLYLMIKSAELPIGWIPDEGPGGGAWPFWLATIMLGSCLWIIINWVRKTSPVAASTEKFMERGVIKDVGLSAGALVVTVALFGFVGVYVALPLFMIFYIGIIGKHTWWLTAIFAVVTPVITFLFFEITLNITLPKGITEEWFYPIFALFY